MTLRKWILLSVLFSMLVGCGKSWSSGDRVLVSKCAYDMGITSPRRYDVVVFKYPGRFEDEGPVVSNTPKNYIKRLLGLPGELLAIFFGRIYRWTPGPDDEPPFDDAKNPGVPPGELFRINFLHTDAGLTRHWFENGKDEQTGKERRFEILRKPPHVLLALRRIVYDNDYQARDLKGKSSFDRWSPDAKSAWKSDRDTGFVYDGKEAGEVDWLRYQHLLRDGGVIAGNVPNKPRLITDTMDYNNFQSRSLPREHEEPGPLVDNTPASQHWIGDLMIECNVEVVEPRGEFWFELSKGIQRFQARWDLTSGQCTLYRLREGKKEEMDTQDTRVKGPGSYLLRFANIDARLTVWADRDLPFGHGKEYDPPEILGPNDKGLTLKEIENRHGPRENDLQPASIGSKGANVKITHVRLWRDTYYTTSAGGGDYTLDREAWSEPTRWDAIRQTKFSIMYVQPGHYLCLGDNSQASSDSRDWGLVPQRLLLGRALAVYFPLERMGPIR